MYSLKIEGFASKEAAEEFWTWFVEQGEQDIQYWWDAQENDKLGDAPMSADTGGWDKKVYIARIKQ
jgi:hypothetical protein